MPLSHILTVYVISFLLVFLPSFGLAKMFQKAGVASWKAYVPFYNTWIMQQLAHRPTHWVFWQAIPVIGWFITPGIFIEFVKLFGRFSLVDHTGAALAAPLYFPYLGYNDKVRYIGPEGVRRYVKPAWREWIDAAVFAIVAATLIRTFVFEAYTIPSGSMEKTLLINDFLFVSKFSYGPRIPNTPLSIPFVHNYIPGSSRKSYTELVKLPYIRWFRSPVKRGDVVVFNFPAGDTVINRPEFQSFRPYYDVVRQAGAGNEARGRELIQGNSDEYPLAIHPPDKTDNYIKRCVAVAGDTLQIKNAVVHINGVAQAPPPNSVMPYIIETNGQQLDETVMKEEYGIDIYNPEQFQPGGNNLYQMWLTPVAVQKLNGSQLVKKMEPRLVDTAFYDPSFNNYVIENAWTIDNFGPIWVPQKGATLVLNPRLYSIYERVIRVYERNDFYMKDGQVFSQKDIESYFKRISVPSVPSYFKPLSNKRVIQHLLEEMAQCFNEEKNRYKKGELLQLASLLD